MRLTRISSTENRRSAVLSLLEHTLSYFLLYLSAQIFQFSRFIYSSNHFYAARSNCCFYYSLLFAIIFFGLFPVARAASRSPSSLCCSANHFDLVVEHARSVERHRHGHKMEAHLYELFAISRLVFSLPLALETLFPADK